MLTSQPPFNDPAWQLAAEYLLPCEPGCEDRDAQLVSERLAGAVQALGLSGPQLVRLKAAVLRAAYNGVRHPRPAGAVLPVRLRLFVEQKERQKEGWGNFLVERAIQGPDDAYGAPCYLIEVYLYSEGK